MKKIIGALALVLALSVASTYYYFSGREYVYRFTEAQLQDALDARLPLTRSYLVFFEVTLDKPRVSLTEGSDRVRAGMDIVLNVKLGKEAKPLGGTIDVTGGVRYVSADGQFFLTDPVIERLELQGVSPKYAKSIRTAMTKAVAEYYATHPIYTLRASNAKQAATRLVLKDVVVQGHTLVVTLGV